MNKLHSTKRQTETVFQQHKEREKHKKENPLRNVILGGQDGLVTALGIVLGVSAAYILIATVLAATFSESLSMRVVAYTSAIS